MRRTRRYIVTFRRAMPDGYETVTCRAWAPEMGRAIAAVRWRLERERGSGWGLHEAEREERPSPSIASVLAGIGGLAACALGITFVRLAPGHVGRPMILAALATIVVMIALVAFLEERAS